MLKTTSNNKRYWEKRKINWSAHYWNPEHKHRDYIIALLGRLKFTSLLEVGCGAGANLHRVLCAFPNVILGGVELNTDAVAEARKRLPSATIEPGPIDYMFFSDKSVDITLSDAALLYYGPLKIKKALKEIDRVTRSGILFVELYHPKWWKRQLLRFSGYNAHNYPKILKKMGYYDIEALKIPKEAWPGGPWEEFGYFVTAKK